MTTTAPSLTLAHAAEVAHAFQTTLRAHRPPHPTHALPADRRNLTIGSYLRSLGYVTESDLRRVQRIQQENFLAPRPARFGQELVNQGVVPADVLGVVLVMQLMDRIMAESFQPRLLGELLIAHSLLTPLQLLMGLQTQASAEQRQAPLELGVILVRSGAVRMEAVQRTLAVQRIREQAAGLRARLVAN